MSEASAIERALCCGATCGRGTEAAGPCIAAVYGRKKHTDIKAAGYRVVTQPLAELENQGAKA